MRILMNLCLCLNAICLVDKAFGFDVEVTLSGLEGVTLGQGFDINTYTWKETCVSGREIGSPIRNAEFHEDQKISELFVYEKMAGSLSGGLTILGGLASVKVKNSYLNTWQSSESSESIVTTYRMSGGSRGLVDVKPSTATSNRRVLPSSCGNYFVSRLVFAPEVSLYTRFRSNDVEWFQKNINKFTKKIGWGAAKKSWTEVEIKEAKEANSSLTVSIDANSIFRSLLSSSLGTSGRTLVTCKIDDFEDCYLSIGLFKDALAVLTEAYDGFLRTDSNTLKSEFATKAILTSYDSAFGRDLLSQRVKVEYDDLVALNQSYQKKYTYESKIENGLSLSLDEIENYRKLNKQILKCEEYQVCEFQN